MYALVLLLVLLGVLALHGALRRPVAAAPGPRHRCRGAARPDALLVAVPARGRRRRGCGRGRARSRRPGPPAGACSRWPPAACCSCPWLPVFLFQAAHTGHAVGRPAAAGPCWSRPGRAGPDRGCPASCSACCCWSWRWPRPSCGRDAAPTARTACCCACPRSRLPRAAQPAPPSPRSSSASASPCCSPPGYALRYSAVALVPALLAAAVGLQALPRRARAVALCTWSRSGSLTTVRLPFDDRRTQAPSTAAAIEARLTPGDLVLYCPDQLGPARRRGCCRRRHRPARLPDRRPPRAGRLGRLRRAQRGRRPGPLRRARRTGATGARLAGHGASGYRTYGDACDAPRRARWPRPARARSSSCWTSAAGSYESARALPVRRPRA